MEACPESLEGAPELLAGRSSYSAKSLAIGRGLEKRPWPLTLPPNKAAQPYGWAVCVLPTGLEVVRNTK